MDSLTYMPISTDECFHRGQPVYNALSQSGLPELVIQLPPISQKYILFPEILLLSTRNFRHLAVIIVDSQLRLPIYCPHQLTRDRKHELIEFLCG